MVLVRGDGCVRLKYADQVLADEEIVSRPTIFDELPAFSEQDSEELESKPTGPGATEKMMRGGKTKSRKIALKRLSKDLRLCFEEFMPGVSACPIAADNLLEWHGNIRGLGAYEGMVFHFKIKLDDDYPTGAPRVKILTGLRHPFVFGDWICLDILEKDWCPGGHWEMNGKILKRYQIGAVYVSDKKDRFSGWSTAYTLQTVLMQLQGFLMDEDIARRTCYSSEKHVTPKQFQEKVDYAKSSCKSFRCPCGHTADRVWPPFRTEAVPKNDDAAIAVAFENMIKQASTKEVLPGHLLCGAYEIPDPQVTSVKSVVTACSSSKRECKRKESKGEESKTSVVERKTDQPTSVIQNLVVGDRITVRVDFVTKDKACLSPVESSQHSLEAATVVLVMFPQVTWKDLIFSIGLPAVGDIVETFVQRVQPRKIQLSLSPVRPVQSVRSVRSVRPVRPVRPVIGRALQGVVTTVQSYGAFVNVGWKKDGLVHVSKIGAQRLYTNDVITVYVLDLDHNKGRLSLGLVAPPLKDSMIEGEPVKAVVRSVVPGLGIFVDVGAQADVLCHESTARHVLKCWDVSKVVKAGMSCLVSVTKSKSRRRQSLSNSNKRSSKLSCSLISLDFNETKTETDITTTVISSSGRTGSLFDQIPEHLMNYLMNYLFSRGSDDVSFSLVCTRFYDMKQTFIVSSMIRQDLTCFFSKRTVDEDILGYGVALEHYPERSNDDLPRLAYAHVTMDLLSLTSFGQDKVRQSAFQENFTHWIPLVIDHDHWSRSKFVARECLAMMYDSRWKSRRTPLQFHPAMVLSVLPKILNTLVVGVMSGDMYASVAALEGYLAFSHLLLSFAKEHPSVQELIEKRLEEFLESEQSRNKRTCPSLGDLITMLIVSDKISFDDFIRVYLDEMFDRNAKWCLATNPTLADVSADFKGGGRGGGGRGGGGSAVSTSRMKKTFEACKTSIKLVCFHKAFFSLIRPASEKELTADGIRRRLDAQMGRPTPKMERELQGQVKKILTINNWAGMFEFLELDTPTDAYLSQWLRRAVVNSGRRGYHRQSAVLRSNVEKQRTGNAARAAVRKLAQEQLQEEEFYAGDFEDHAAMFD